MYQKDVTSVENSNFNNFYKDVSINTSLNYLNINVSLTKTRIIAQIKLSNNYMYTFANNNIRYRIDAKVNCSICNAEEPESMHHFLFTCPIYQPLRRAYLSKYLQNPNNSNFVNLLTN